MKKRILPILTGLWPYLTFGIYLLACFGGSQDFSVASIVMLSVLCLSPALGLICLVLGLTRTGNSAEALTRQNLHIKLTHMPFYILIFLAFLVSPVALPVFFLFDAMALIVSSGFGIAAILRARKEGLLTTVRTIGHIIAHCFFIADLISAFLVWKRLRTASVTN